MEHQNIIPWIGQRTQMYGKGRHGCQLTPLDSASKAIWSQMQGKKIRKSTTKIGDFTRIQILFIVTKVNFRRRKTKNSNFDKFYKEKWQKNQNKKFGLAFDSGLKLISESLGKKSPMHLCLTDQHTDQVTDRHRDQHKDQHTTQRTNRSTDKPSPIQRLDGPF